MDDADGFRPVPGLDSDVKRGRLLYTLNVDSEVFAVRSYDGGTDYDWITGRNEGYGFGSSGSAEGNSRQAHEDNICNFLAMIDPETGFIAED